MGLEEEEVSDDEVLEELLPPSQLVEYKAKQKQISVVGTPMVA